MRHRGITIVVTGIMTMGAFVAPGMVAPLQAQTQVQQNVNEATRQSMINEYGKGILADSAAAQNPPTTRAQNDIRERDQIANQLTLFTENEDIKYIIVEGDTLTISYHDRDQVNRAAYKVSVNGEIFIPLCGPVKVAGLNRRQTRERVEMVLKEYIRDPQPILAINTDGRVMVFGAVGTPGVFDIRSKLTVLEAILTAGGYNRSTAEMASVIVVRGPVEKRTVFKLNLKKLVTKGDQSDNIYVKPGDFIYVPVTFISNLDTFWNTMSKYLMWWYGLGGSQPVANDRWQWGVGAKYGL